MTWADQCSMDRNLYGTGIQDIKTINTYPTDYQHISAVKEQS